MLRSLFAPVLLLAALLMHLPAQSQIRVDGQVRDARTQ